MAFILGGKQLAGVSAFHAFVRAAAVDAAATSSSGAGLMTGIAGRVNRYTIHARDRLATPLPELAPSSVWRLWTPTAARRR